MGERIKPGCVIAAVPAAALAGYYIYSRSQEDANQGPIREIEFPTDNQALKIGTYQGLVDKEGIPNNLPDAAFQVEGIEVEGGVVPTLDTDNVCETLIDLGKISSDDSIPCDNEMLGGDTLANIENGHYVDRTIHGFNETADGIVRGPFSFRIPMECSDSGCMVVIGDSRVAPSDLAEVIDLSSDTTEVKTSDWLLSDLPMVFSVIVVLAFVKRWIDSVAKRIGKIGNKAHK